MDCLPQNVIDIILGMPVDSSRSTGDLPNLRDFFALAGTCRAIRARCLESVRIRHDPMGNPWNICTGPDPRAFSTFGETFIPHSRLCAGESNRRDYFMALRKSRTCAFVSLAFMRASNAIIISAEREFMFMCAEDDGLVGLPSEVYGFVIQETDREAVNYIVRGMTPNRIADLSKHIHVINVVERKLSHELITHGRYNCMDVANIARIEMQRGDIDFPYLRECVGTIRKQYCDIDAASLIFSYNLPSRIMLRVLVEVLGDLLPVLPNIIVYARHANCATLEPMRELVRMIPRSSAIAQKIGEAVLAPRLAMSYVAREWAYVAFWRDLRRILGLNRSRHINARIIAHLALEYVAREVRWPNKREMRIIMSAICTIAPGDCDVWSQAISYCAHAYDERMRDERLSGFISRARCAWLRK